MPGRRIARRISSAATRTAQPRLGERLVAKGLDALHRGYEARLGGVVVDETDGFRADAADQGFPAMRGGQGRAPARNFPAAVISPHLSLPRNSPHVEIPQVFDQLRCEGVGPSLSPFCLTARRDRIATFVFVGAGLF